MALCSFSRPKPYSSFVCKKEALPGRKRCRMCTERCRRAARKRHGIALSRPVRKWTRETNPKEKARHCVFVALRAGRLVRPDRCSRCQKRCKVESHHHRGYGVENRLRIKWMCRSCHFAAERLIKKTRRQLAEVRRRCEALRKRS